MGNRGETSVPVLKSFSEGRSKCRTGSCQKVGEITLVGGAGREPTCSGFSSPVSPKPIGTVPSTEHSGLYSSCPYCSWRRATGHPKWMGSSSQRQEGGAEEEQAGEV